MIGRGEPVGHGGARVDMAAGLAEIAREGARRLLLQTLEAEVDAVIEQTAGELDDAGHRLVRRNGHARPRQVATVLGSLVVSAPRVDDRRVDAGTGRRLRFRSAILPPWSRSAPTVTATLPLLYLRGMSSGDFVPALEGMLGSTTGLPASVAVRVTRRWRDDQRAFADSDLSTRDDAGVRAVGVHAVGATDPNGGADPSCLLVLLGVRPDGRSELVGLADGACASPAAWAGLLRDARRRGMRPPQRVAGDHGLGFWPALREVFGADVAAPPTSPAVTSRR